MNAGRSRWRRASQAAVFLVFAFLFLKTEYRGQDVIPYAVNIFLRLDPLVAATAVLAGRALISLVWPALVTIALTALLGRFFCGWVCPLGACFDAVGAVFFKKRRRRGAPGWLRNGKYLILAGLMVSSLFTLQFVFLFDPISLLIRSLTVAVYPAVNLAVNEVFAFLYHKAPAPVTALTEPVYSLLREHFLAFSQPYYRLPALIGAIFMCVLGLEYFQRRFWCRNLCPLGGMLGLAGRWNPFRRRVSEACVDCGLCAKTCRSGAIDEDYRSTRHAECVACLDCRDVCPEGAVSFAGKLPPADKPLDISRRSLLAAAGSGLALTPIFGTDGIKKAPHPGLIRPPGSLPETEFLARCTRCGECMRVCVANGLHPTFLEAGLPGLFSPILAPRLGYCEYNCTLCGQVCPTGAITRLEPEKKRQARLGLAEVDRSHCLPWKGESDCIVCEEHCPTPKKAIVLRRETVARKDGSSAVYMLPYVVEELCIGCGICEYKCPLQDRAAIRVSSRGESRSRPNAG